MADLIAIPLLLDKVRNIEVLEIFACLKKGEKFWNRAANTLVILEIDRLQCGCTFSERSEQIFDSLLASILVDLNLFKTQLLRKDLGHSFEAILFKSVSAGVKLS